MSGLRGRGDAETEGRGGKDSGERGAGEKAYWGRLASLEPRGPGYRIDAPLTWNESESTAGVRIEPGRSYGFFTDTTVCIGCKACEVACKQWNRIPMDHLRFSEHSYDNTGMLSATTWRHVAFIEQSGDGGWGMGNGRRQDSHSLSPIPYPQTPNTHHPTPIRWLFMSDVCKHCENAGCLEACPTGAIVRTEFGSVLIQQDVCNGCKYCVASCPFGVITVDEHGSGTARKCTLCYDRLKGGLEPACAKACPTDSIQFGPVDLLRERASERVEELRRRGIADTYLYGVPGSPGATGGVGSLNCFFLLSDRPEVYNLPPAPELPSRRVVPSSLTAAATALLYAAAATLVILRVRRRDK